MQDKGCKDCTDNVQRMVCSVCAEAYGCLSYYYSKIQTCLEGSQVDMLHQMNIAYMRAAIDPIMVTGSTEVVREASDFFFRDFCKRPVLLVKNDDTLLLQEVVREMFVREMMRTHGVGNIAEINSYNVFGDYAVVAMPEKMVPVNHLVKDLSDELVTHADLYFEKGESANLYGYNENHDLQIGNRIYHYRVQNDDNAIIAFLLYIGEVAEDLVGATSESEITVVEAKLFIVAGRDLDFGDQEFIPERVLMGTHVREELGYLNLLKTRINMVYTGLEEDTFIWLDDVYEGFTYLNTRDGVNCAELSALVIDTGGLIVGSKTMPDNCAKILGYPSRSVGFLLEEDFGRLGVKGYFDMTQVTVYGVTYAHILPGKTYTAMELALVLSVYKASFKSV